MTDRPNIAALLDASGLSGGQIARAVGVSPQAVSLWRCGQARPGRRVVRRLAAVLGVEPAAALRAGPGATPVERARAAICATGRTMAELAAEHGSNKSTIAGWTSRARYRCYATRIARMTGVSVGWILYGYHN